MASKAVKLKDAQGNKVYPCPYYPVGSIYMNINDIDPALIFGGTWERIQGRFLLGATTNNTHPSGQTGGSETHRHDFKIALPFCYMDVVADNLDSDVFGAYAYSLNRYGKARNNNESTAYGVNANGGHTDGMKGHDGRVASSTGDTDIGSSMPPFLAVYIWKRIA